MTTSEARAILFVNAVLSDFCKSLHREQLEALKDIFDETQKILVLTIFDTVRPADAADEAILSERQEAWTKLVQAAEEQIDGELEAPR